MKKPIILIIGILLLPIASALISESSDTKIDFTIKPSSSSESSGVRLETIINTTARNDTKGNLFTRIVSVIVEVITPGGGGGPSKKAVALYYDVLIDVEKDVYSTKENIIANITIINKGYIPDRDGILISYIEDPRGVKYREKKEEFELIPPTCIIGTFNWYTNLCEIDNQIFEPKRIIITRVVALPLDAILGEWKFHATYQTRIQPLIEVYDSFEVYSAKSFFMIGMALLIAYALIKRKKKKRGI